MTKIKQVYKCEICGNIVEVLHSGPGELVCCGKSMTLLIEKNKEEGFEEKHLPKISQEGEDLKIQIGEVLHPMTKEHHIEWIEIQTNNKIIRKVFDPEETPLTLISCLNISNIQKIRAYCNLHGLWELDLSK